MKFEEFKELALNPPLYKGGTICKLVVYGYYDEWVDESGCYGLIKAWSAYYGAWAEANSDMSRVYKEVCKDGMKIYCSFICEIPTYIDMRFEKYTRVLAYDSECELIDLTLGSFPCRMNNEENDMFRGRDESMIRFKPRDIVEVMTFYGESQPSINTAIITKVPPNIEESWDLFKNLKELSGDIESDKYSYLIGEHWECGNNSFAPSFLVFKPRVPVSEQRKKELIEYYDNYTGHVFWRQGGSRLDEIAQAVGGLSPDMFPGVKNLSPKDFDPIYKAVEVVYLCETVDFDVENPLGVILGKIEEWAETLSNFTNFIISLTNTNWRGKRLLPNRVAEWERKIAARLPHARCLSWGERIMQGAMYYRIDIVAYN